MGDGKRPGSGQRQSSRSAQELLDEAEERRLEVVALLEERRRGWIIVEMRVRDQGLLIRLSDPDTLFKADYAVTTSARHMVTDFLLSDPAKSDREVD
jgi:hypothetical protein